MFFNISPLVAFRDMLCLTFASAGMRIPVHPVLVSTIINTMALFAVSGTQARFRGTNIVNDILSVSDQVTRLSVCLNINVQFRFDNILEVPMGIISDGHVIGFETFHLYFKNKRVSPEELRRAEVLFNFIAIVRHLSGLLEPQGILDLIEDFKKPAVASALPDRKMTRSRSRRNGLCRIPSRPIERRPLTAQDLNAMAANSNIAQRKDKSNNTTKQHNRSKRHARIWNDENVLPTPEHERRERNRRKVLAGFI